MMQNCSKQPILVVCRTFLPKEGGIEEYVYNRCLQDVGEVVVLTAHQPGDRGFDRAQPFPIYRWFSLDLPGLGTLNSLLKQVINMICSFVMALELYRRYRYRAIEWGHGYDFPPLLLLSYLLPVQCFLYLHGNDLLCPLRHPILTSWFRWTLTRCTGIVCNSQFTSDYLQRHLTITTPIHVINPTVRPSKFGFGQGIGEGVMDVRMISADLRRSLRQQYQIPESAIVILSVGRLVPRKGFDQVITHLPHLLAAGCDVHYLVCGRGAMLPTLQSLADTLGVDDRVHFAGFVPDYQLAHHYAACDLFSMITAFDQKAASIEGFGIVYLEAGYFGKPVIAARIGGVSDAVRHNETGLLVEPDSPEDSLQALLRLCGDRALRERLGQRGRELATSPTPHRIIYDLQEAR